MSSNSAGFNPEQYKAATRDQWDRSGAGYNKWGHVIQALTAKSMEWMLDTGGISGGHRVLELASGGGVQTLLLAKRVGPEGRVMATDISPGILAFTEQNAKAAGLGNVETRVMDGEKVDVPEASFDAVVSSLGLMFFPAPLESLQNQVRALKPGGRVGAMVISVPEKNQFFSLPAKVIRERAALPPPPPGMPGPFALGAPGMLAGMFKEAGLMNVQSETIGGLLELPSISEHMSFLGDAFGALHMLMVKMDEAEKQATWDAVAQALESFDGAEGFKAPFELITCVGTR